MKGSSMASASGLWASQCLSSPLTWGRGLEWAGAVCFSSSGKFVVLVESLSHVQLFL